MRDVTYVGGTTSATGSEVTPLTSYLSKFNITETAGSTCYVKLRDSISLPTAPTIVAAAAGSNNIDVGLHMVAVTWVTRHGESLIGPLVEFSAAGGATATVTIPVGPATTATSTWAAIVDTIVGRRIYVTKAGAPATTVTPTIAQWFRLVADLSATIAAGMNNKPLAGNTTLTVNSTTGFKATNGNLLVTTTTGVQPVSYTALTGTTFTGVTMLRPSGTGGYLATGNAVTQPMIGDNTATSYTWDTADAGLTATNPPTIDTAGRRIESLKISAAASVGDGYGDNVSGLFNGGGLYVEVTSGACEWTVRGQ